MLVLQAIRRGTDTYKEQAAFKAPDDDGAFTELHGDSNGSDGAS